MLKHFYTCYSTGQYTNPNTIIGCVFHMGAHVCRCTETQRPTSGIMLFRRYQLCPSPLRETAKTGSLTGLELCGQVRLTGWTASLRNTPVSTTPVLGLIVSPCWVFSHGLWGFNSRPSACVARVSLTELCPNTKNEQNTFFHYLSFYLYFIIICCAFKVHKSLHFSLNPPNVVIICL